jgi:hypothetical protein
MHLRYAQISIDSISPKLVTYTAEAYVLSTCEKREMMRRMFGPKYEEIIRKIRKHYNKDVSQMICVIDSNLTIWEGHV